MTTPADPDIGLGVAADPVDAAIDQVGSGALHILEVVIGHRRKAIDGGFPEAIADSMAFGLWSLMMQQAFKVAT